MQQYRFAACGIWVRNAWTRYCTFTFTFTLTYFKQAKPTLVNLSPWPLIKAKPRTKPPLVQFPWLCSLSQTHQASGFKDKLILHTSEREGLNHWQYHKVVAKLHFMARSGSQDLIMGPILNPIDQIGIPYIPYICGKSKNNYTQKCQKKNLLISQGTPLRQLVLQVKKLPGEV